MVKPVRRSRSRLPPVMRVHGQHHDVDAGVLGRSHHGLVEAAILVEIELIDLRRDNSLRISSRLTVPSEETPNIVPNFSAAARHRAFALMMKQPLQSGR